MFFTFVNVFHSFPPDVVHFLECGKSTEKWADSNRYQHGSGAGVWGALVLWCSGTWMGSGALNRGSWFWLLGTRMGSDARYSKGHPERLGIKSHTHHHMEWCRMLSSGLHCARSRWQQMEWIANKTKPDNLSKETTKQHQTTSKPSEPLTHHGFGVFLYRSFCSPLFCDQNEPLVMPNGPVLTKLWSKEIQKKISAKCGL